MFDVNDIRKQLKNIEKDDLLKMIGVEERRTGAEVFFTGLGLFAAGVLVGAGAALLLAPKPGSELRQDLKGRIQGNIPSQIGIGGQQTTQRQA